MRLPTVAMGLLSLPMTPVAVAALLIVPSLLTNLWQLWAGPNFRALLRRLASMVLAIVVGTAIGIGVLTGASVGIASLLLGVVLALYGLLGLFGCVFRTPSGAEHGLSPLVGLLIGLISGATEVFVIPAVPYLSSLGLVREDLIQALGLSFTISTLALGASLAWSGNYSLPMAGNSMLALVLALLGVFLGQRLRLRLGAEIFRCCFFVGLLLLGSYMLLRAL